MDSRYNRLDSREGTLYFVNNSGNRSSKPINANSPLDVVGKSFAGFEETETSWTQSRYFGTKLTRPSRPTGPQGQRRRAACQNHIQRYKSNGREIVVVEEDSADDVIDLGAPRGVRNCRSQFQRTSPSGAQRRPYTPNPRLYPGPQAKPKPKSKPKAKSKTRQKHTRSTIQKHVRRRKRVNNPVPNSRLYRPAPPRPKPPPLHPYVSWPPPPPPRSLETASNVALRFGEQRRVARTVAASTHNRRAPQAAPASNPISPPQLSKRLVVTLPQPQIDSPSPVTCYQPTSEHFKVPDSPIPTRSRSSTPPAARLPSHKRIMEPANRNSASPEDRSEGNETLSAPSEFLAEFLSAIMRRQYAEALKYCRLILQYEPQNKTARGFYPLLQHKVQVQRKGEMAGSPLHGSSSEDASGASPALARPAGGSVGARRRRRSSSEASASPPPPQEPPQPELDSADSEPDEPDEPDDASAGSGASQSSLELDSDVLHSSPSLSLSRRTDSGSAGSAGCWESTGSASRSEADDNGNAPATTAPTNTLHPADLENDNATGAGEPAHNKMASDSLASLRRLRAHFACSIK